MLPDALTTILETLRANSCVFSRAELTAPWGVSSQQTATAIFHVVVEGSAFVRVAPDGPLEPLSVGDLVLFPMGSAHHIVSKSAAPLVPITSLEREKGAGVCPVVRAGGDGVRTRLICGLVNLEPVGRHLLMGQLPPMIVVNSADNTAAWLSTTLKMLSGALKGDAPGARLLSLRLADVLLVQILRSFSHRSDSGLFAAMGDPHLSRALSAFHHEPGSVWSVVDLARQAGMSRSGFYAAFARIVGRTPAAYMREWRLYLAGRALREGATLESAAERIGYSSGSALAEVFRRNYGCSPRAWLAAQP